MAGKAGFLERASGLATRWTGTSTAFALALLTIVVWAVTGPVFNYSDTWQLVINTGTTIVTFLMVFLIQRQQNKDSLTIQLKLNELVAAARGASNRLINVEDLTEDEVRELHDRYQKLAEVVKQDKKLTAPHTIEEAEKVEEAQEAVAEAGEKVAAAEKAVAKA